MSHSPLFTSRAGRHHARVTRNRGYRLLGLVAAMCSVTLSCGSGSSGTAGLDRPAAAASPAAPTSSAPASSAPASSAPTALTAAPRAATVGSSVWVSVAVATLWVSPTSPRRIDAKAVSAPVDIRGWLAAMSTTARRGLVGRVETQALYGDRLLVTGVRTGWLHVVAIGQATHRDARGYPGWVPTRQTTTTRPLSTTQVATVTQLTTWLRNTYGHRVIEVSIGTRLPVISRTTTSVTVATPTHQRLVVTATAVVLRRPAAAALGRTTTGVIHTARAFLGRPYLWGGRSGFAVDCSGLTQLAYLLHGVAIPRDTDDQARAGRAASLSSLRAGDLLFFRSGSAVTHVGIYVGNGQMLHAPRTGLNVQVSGMGRPALARRFI